MLLGLQGFDKKPWTGEQWEFALQLLSSFSCQRRGGLKNRLWRVYNLEIMVKVISSSQFWYQQTPMLGIFPIFACSFIKRGFSQYKFVKFNISFKTVFSMFFHQLTGIPGKMYEIFKITLQGTNISTKNGIFEEDFPFPQVGYVGFLEGKITTTMGWFLVETPLFILEGLEPSTVTYGAACSACGRCKRWQQARQQNINPPLQVEWFSKFCWSDVAWICPSKIECICFGLVLDDWHVKKTPSSKATRWNQPKYILRVLCSFQGW